VLTRSRPSLPARVLNRCPPVHRRTLGLPIFCCTVGAEEGGRIVAGCTTDPMRGESFMAARDEGASLKSPSGTMPLKVAPIDDLTDAVVCTGFPYGDRDKLPRMIAFGRFTELARGFAQARERRDRPGVGRRRRLDGFYETGLKTLLISPTVRPGRRPGS
jgi:myo-inositol-1(or 4)-monophosphatase